MAYLVRKINKKKNIDALRGNLNVDELTADMPTGELRTTNGTLSTWIVESLGELNEAILAIAVTSSKVLISFFTTFARSFFCTSNSFSIAFI